MIRPAQRVPSLAVLKVRPVPPEVPPIDGSDLRSIHVPILRAGSVRRLPPISEPTLTAPLLRAHDVCPERRREAVLRHQEWLRRQGMRS